MKNKSQTKYCKDPELKTRLLIDTIECEEDIEEDRCRQYKILLGIAVATIFILLCIIFYMYSLLRCCN